MNTNRVTEDTVYYDIVNGPSRGALFDACKYAYDKRMRLAVDLVVAAGYTAPKSDPGAAYIPMPIHSIRICSIEHEDGSGESFNLSGYCRAVPDTMNGGIAHDYRFEAYYNAKNRKGTIRFFG